MKILPRLLCALSAALPITSCMAAVDDGMSSDSAGQNQGLENGREINIATGSTKKAKLFGATNASNVFVIIGGIKGDPETSTFAKNISDYFAIDANESALPRGAGVIVIEDAADADINGTFACNQTQVNNPQTNALVSFLTARKASIRGVVSLRSFRAADAYAGRCGDAHSASDTLAASYASTINGTKKTPVPGTGNLVDWLAAEYLPAVEVGAHGTGADHAAAVRNAFFPLLSLYHVPPSDVPADARFVPYQPTIGLRLPCNITTTARDLTMDCGSTRFTAPIMPGNEDDFEPPYAVGDIKGSLNVSCQGDAIGTLTSGTQTYRVVIEIAGGAPSSILLEGSERPCSLQTDWWRFWGNM